MFIKPFEPEVLEWLANKWQERYGESEEDKLIRLIEGQPEEETLREQQLREVYQLIEQLPERERYIMEQYLQGVPYRSIAKQLGVCHQRIHFIIQRTTKTLKAMRGE